VLKIAQISSNADRIKDGDKKVNLTAFKIFISREINGANADPEDQIRLLLKVLYLTDHIRQSFAQLDSLSQQQVDDFLYGESTSYRPRCPQHCWSSDQACISRILQAIIDTRHG
jgi:hypothetical protein